jgi:hypothetical protein
MSRTTRRKYRAAAVVFGVLSSLSCGGDLPAHHTIVSGRVFWAGPVEGAKVKIFQVLPSGLLYQEAPIAETTTDHDGAYTLDVGQQGNVMLLTAAGGAFDDPASGTRIALDGGVVLRGYQQHIELDEVRSTAILSPITTLQADLADARRREGRADSLHADDSIDRARALLGSHLLDLNAENTVPADVFSSAATPAASPTSEYRYGIVLAGMSQYAAEVAAASGLTVKDLNITHITQALSADLSSAPDVLFNGHSSTGFTRVGACPLKQDCPAGTDFDAKPECRTACDLFANSPRAYLARAILAWLGDPRNKSGLKPEDLRSRLEQLAANVNPDLFSDTPPEPLLNEGPAISFDSPTGTVMGLVDIKVTATSPVGVQDLTVTWDASTPGPVLVDANPDPAVFEIHGFDTTQLGDDVWKLTAHGTDSLGHATDATGSFTVDNFGSGTISGVVIKGPISGATVRAFRFTGGVRGALLGTGTTNASGVFSNVTLAQGYSGPVEVAIGRTGVYTEEASPVQVTVDVDNELRTVIPNYADGQAVGQVVVTPITSFATALLDWKVVQAGATPNVPTLWQEAVAAMQAQFDIPDIEHLTPIPPNAIVTLSGGARYSLVLTGLSQRALQVSSNRPAGTGDAGSFPSVMNSLVVTAKLEADLRADGCWNGKSGAADLQYGGTTKVSKDDTRIGLASAIVAYVQGTENQTPFAGAGDLLGLLDTLSLGGVSTGAGGCTGGGIYADEGTVYDQEAPTVQFTAEPGDLFALEPVVRGTIHLVATGDDHGIDAKPSTIIQRDATPPVPLTDTDGDATDADAHVTIDTAALGDGPQTLTATSTDDSGNDGSAQHSFIIDNTAPVVTITGVIDDAWYSAASVTPTVTVVDANLKSSTVTLDGAPYTSGTAVSTEATHELFVSATDKAGATTTKTVTFSIDRTKPVVTWGATTPADGAFLRSMFVVDADATDNLALNTFAMTAPSGQTDTNTTVAHAHYDLNASTLGDQTLTVTLTAVDRAGNQQTATRTFILDTTPPVVMITTTGLLALGTPTVYWTDHTGGVTLTGSAADTHLQSVTVTNTTTGAVCGSTTASPWSVPLTCLAEGTNAITVVALDAAGNMGTKTVALGLDTSPPVLTLVQSEVFDEANDTVVTMSGTTPIAPEHTHTGGKPALDRSTDCTNPTPISLYGYLHDQDVQQYGKNLDRNPFVWKFNAKDPGVGIDATANPTQYRISLYGGAVLSDWRNLTGVDDGTGGQNFETTLYRRLTGGVTTAPAIPKLDSVDGVFQIDFRATDRFNRTRVETRCWLHHPLAAPLSVEATARPAQQVTALSALALGTPSKSVASLLLNDSSPGAGLTEFKVTNMTAETVYTTFTLKPPTDASGLPINPTYTKAAKRSWLEEGKSTTPVACDFKQGPCMPRSDLVSSASNVPTATPFAPAYSMRVFDTSGTAFEMTPCSGCTNTNLVQEYAIGPRFSSGARVATVISVIKTVPQLRPAGATIFSEPTLSYFVPPSGNTPISITFTGTYFSTMQACDVLVNIPHAGGDPDTYRCDRVGTYREYTALSSAAISFNGTGANVFETTVDSATTASVAPIHAGPVWSTLGFPSNWTHSQTLPANP